MLTDLSLQPDLVDQVDELIAANMPEFMGWESPGNWRWHRIYDLFPQFQLCLAGADGSVLACANAIPVPWDGTVPGLPAGTDEVLTKVIDGLWPAPTALCALSVSVRPEHRRAGYAQQLLTELVSRSARTLPGGVLVPVRPTRKSRYPLIPMTHYVTWQHPDGSRFDPWLRTHEELGARLLAVAERSLVITQPASRWAEVTGHALPGPGSYVVPGALAPVVVDADRNGTYAEPNAWVHHSTGTEI